MSDLARERGVQPARRDVRARGRRGPRDPLPRLHRQRRRRRRRPPAHPRAAWRSASPTRARTSTSCATRRCPPTCSAPGCASAQVMPLEQAVRKLTGEPADMFGFVAARLPARGRLGRRVRVRSGDGRHGTDPARARLPGRRRAPDRRGADRRAARAGERHADPPRRRSSSTPTAGRAARPELA